MKEAQIQKSICDYLTLQEKLGRLIFCKTSVGSLKLATGRYFKTGKVGWPDITVLKGGKFYGLEVKTAKGIQSDAQKAMSFLIERQYGVYAVVRNLDDVMRVLR